MSVSGQGGQRVGVRLGRLTEDAATSFVPTLRAPRLSGPHRPRVTGPKMGGHVLVRFSGCTLGGLFLARGAGSDQRRVVRMGAARALQSTAGARRDEVESHQPPEEEKVGAEARGRLIMKVC